MSTKLLRSSWSMRGMTSVLLALLVLAAPVRADREQVREVMDAMEKAVLAGDKDAFMAVVWKDDACFLQEQKNWVADFDRHKAEAFALKVKDDAESNFGAEEAWFTLVMEWSMGADVPRGADRRVTVPVVFRKKGEQWLYAGEKWTVMEAPGVDGSAGAIAKYLEGASVPAENAISVLPEVRAHVDHGFEIKIDRVQEVKIYKSVRHLQASIYLSYTDSLGGWNEPHESIKVIAYGCNTKPEAKSLLAHEYGHCATFEYGPHSSKMPWWVLEGIAEVSSEAFTPGAPERISAMVNRWSKKDELAPWEEIADFHDCPKKWMGHVYTQGHHMVRYIIEKAGRPGCNAWLKAMAQGKTLDEATNATLGKSFADLDREWRASLPAAQKEKVPADAGEEDEG